MHLTAFYASGDAERAITTTRNKRIYYVIDNSDSNYYNLDRLDDK